jgi:hypothetical protein
MTFTNHLVLSLYRICRKADSKFGTKLENTLKWVHLACVLFVKIAGGHSFIRTPQYQISCKSIQQFSGCYCGQTDRHGEADRHILATSL